MRKNYFLIPMFCLLWMMSGCDDKKYKPVPPIDGGPDDIENDIVEDIINPTDEIDASDDGPLVTITLPVEDQVLYGENFMVRATVEPTEAPVRYESVNALVNGVNYGMTVDTTVPNGFRALVDLTELPEGSHVLRVTATDTQGRLNYDDVRFHYDTGPVITVYSPEDEGRYHGGVNVSLKVSDNDGVDPGTVRGVVANRNLVLTQSLASTDTANGFPLWVEFTASIIFDDSMFVPPLTGLQRLTVHATNGVGNSAQKAVDFTVDNTGPVIVVTSHEEGQIIGSITKVVAQITDPAGVQSSSVYAVFGNDDINFVVPLYAEQGVNNYEGSFDTSVFPNTFIWPALQIFASDTLGNESSVAFQLALDNHSPILSLDPPETMRLAKKNSDRQLECSREFDPVGWASANDRSLVAQVFWLRARVEDRGNAAAGAAWSPLALVNQASVEMYILDDTTQALAVDMSGDGYCNDINPNLIPTISITGDPRETLKLNMVPLMPAGQADYRVDYFSDLEPPCQAWGVATDPPDPLCPVVEDDLEVLVWYTFDKNEPAIYGLPPFNSASPMYCSGIQFDSMANNISEGWACVVVRAVDHVGNIGVSAPLRVCIDYNPFDMHIPSDCLDLENAPDCTGTWEPATSTVLSTPCTPLLFPEYEVRREE